MIEHIRRYLQPMATVTGLAFELHLRPDYAQESLVEWISERVEHRGHSFRIGHVAADVWLGEGTSDDLARLRHDVVEWLEFYQGVVTYRSWETTGVEQPGRRSRRSPLAA